MTIKEVLELSAAGFTADEIRAYAGSDAPTEASAPVKAARSPKGKKANTFHEKVIKARVACAYASKSCAKVHFAPNGVGATQHTTCPKGRAALAAARA